MKRDLAVLEQPRRHPIISSRFAGAAIRRDADGTFECVLPEPTEFDEWLQQKLIAKKAPSVVYERHFLATRYPHARP